MGVGVKNSRGKNPKYGKNLVVGAKSGGFGITGKGAKNTRLFLIEKLKNH